MRKSLLFTGLVLAAGLAVVNAPARAGIDPSIGRVEVTLELPKDKPYVGEMIMLRMRSFIHAGVVLDEIRQPPLIDFDVQQLGRDKPIQAMVDGFSVDGIERDLAIFPDQAGRLIIPPFVRHVTLIDSLGQRVETEFASKPIYVDVQTYNGVNKPGAWWLPAKSLTITDTWSPEPDEIDRGSLTRRTIVVEAVGLDADRLPPPPEMHAPGTIAFRGPVQRETILTDDGPVARATFTWDLRPATGAPSQVPAITIPWFDTSERRMRTTAIPERWVAYVGTFVHARHDTPRGFRALVMEPAPMLAGVAGFAWAAGLLGLLATRRDGRGRRRWPALSRLSRAARFRDERGFRNALGDLARADPGRWAQVAAKPDVAEALAAFDAARFARGETAPPALTPLAAAIVRGWSQAAPARDDPDDGLPPIDGRIESKPFWRDGGRVVSRLP